jgi:hypothetical protein
MNELFDVKKLDKAVGKALEQVYVAELIKRTPKKTGFLANQWSSHSLGNFSYAITNPHGDIVIYLEEGTKAHTILPKIKKMLKFPIENAPELRSPKEAKAFAEKGVIFFFNRRRQAVLGYSKEGGKYFCYCKKVNHPGFEGKHFIRNIFEDNTLFSRFKDKVLAGL